MHRRNHGSMNTPHIESDAALERRFQKVMVEDQPLKNIDISTAS
jgi:ATP-dependent Clp protease ATP-binding subunit ClpA